MGLTLGLGIHCLESLDLIKKITFARDPFLKLIFSFRGFSYVTTFFNEVIFIVYSRECY